MTFFSRPLPWHCAGHIDTWALDVYRFYSPELLHGMWWIRRIMSKWEGEAIFLFLRLIKEGEIGGKREKFTRQIKNFIWPNIVVILGCQKKQMFCISLYFAQTSKLLWLFVVDLAGWLLKSWFYYWILSHHNFPWFNRFYDFFTVSIKFNKAKSFLS